ncbi:MULTISPECIES: ABC transporter permease [unclassified Halomonas]|uniref:ABC transporter permease n=1 Tax=unclassified Halomonas TaxID=2609666 RepID=UPI0020A1360A|nr:MULTISPECIES: ABC transporter permease [unclassified Halomonas]MCP1314105.1 ABC transporter permease [Halomonas sp. 707D7]MCP1325144.1 ABC transporter permease [Halomonas sp. 707D4]
MASLHVHRHLHLLWQFTCRDITGRYRGSLLGLGWTLLSPLLMLGAFTLVFYGFFDLKWPVEATGTPQMDFALQVFVGLLSFNWFAEVVNRGPVLVTGQPNLVTKVVFPLPLLAFSSVLAASFQALISLLLLMLITAVLVGVKVTWLGLPLVILPFAGVLVGIALWLSALGVYLRDIGPLMALCTSVLMFLSPVFYPLSNVPEQWQGVYLLNPLALLITQLRDVIFMGAWPSPKVVSGLVIVAAVLLASGTWAFNKLRGGFADVL